MTEWCADGVDELRERAVAATGAGEARANKHTGSGPPTVGVAEAAGGAAAAVVTDGRPVKHTCAMAARVTEGMQTGTLPLESLSAAAGDGDYDGDAGGDEREHCAGGCDAIGRL